jgi:hypothetical protein
MNSWTTRELLELFRSITGDVNESAYLWSDQEFCSFLDEAQFEFVKRLGYIKEFDDEDMTTIKTENSEWVKLHPLVVEVDGATFNGRPVEILSPTASSCRVDEALRAGKPVLFRGVRDGYLRWFRPDAGLLVLDIRRTIRNPIKTLDDEPEVYRDHVPRLLSYVYALAYLRKQDAESYDRNKSMEHMLDFEKYVDECKKERTCLRFRMI